MHCMANDERAGFERTARKREPTSPAAAQGHRATAKLSELLANSPRMVAQREAMAQAFGSSLHAPAQAVGRRSAAPQRSPAQTIQRVPGWKKVGIGALTLLGGAAAGVGAVAAGLAAAPVVAAGLAGAAAGAGIGYGMHRAHDYFRGDPVDDASQDHNPVYSQLDALERGQAHDAVSSHATSTSAVARPSPGPSVSERWNHRGPEKWHEFVDERHADHESGPLVYDRTGPGETAGRRTLGRGEPGALSSFLDADRQALDVLNEQRPVDARDYERLHHTLVTPLLSSRATAGDYRNGPATWQTDSAITRETGANLTGLGLSVGPSGDGRSRISTGPAEASDLAWRRRIQTLFDAYYQDPERRDAPSLAVARLARRLDAAHVFNDGTGRVNRLTMNMLLTQAGGMPVSMGHTNMPTEMSDEGLAGYLESQQKLARSRPAGNQHQVEALHQAASELRELEVTIARAQKENDHMGAVIAEMGLPDVEIRLLRAGTNQVSPSASADSSSFSGASRDSDSKGKEHAQDSEDDESLL